jgi:methylmalonyl-CoA mutase N-terminal domain/subunit
MSPGLGEEAGAVRRTPPATGDSEVKISRTMTWGSLPTEPSYGPLDSAAVDYARDLGNPGEYPYTRGAYPQMYRSRMWTLRHIVGYGAPEDTRDGIEKARLAGATGINIVVDTLTQQAIDPDHPAFAPEVGLEGCSLPSLRDAERLLTGINVTQQDVAWHSTILTYPLVAALAVKQGLPLNKLQGSNMPDHLSLTLSGWGTELLPPKMAQRITADCIEFSVKNSPRWALGMPQAYDLRERGLTPAGEIAVGMAIVNQLIEDLKQRGTPVDRVAPSLAWVSTSDIDFFEEIAKFRALRRIWAKTMKIRHGASDPRSMRLRIACHTAGKSLTYQQPLNNLSRAAIQTMAALLGGVQSVETCTYDEPVCIPTHAARDLAIRTQQILANEVGAARTADPLGGSYYVESLTNTVEKEALKQLADIEAIGLIRAIADRHIETLMDRHNAQFQRELAAKERIVVGVNEFVHAPEAPPPRFSFDSTNTREHLRRFAELKRTRNQHALTEKLRALYLATANDENTHPAMIDAFIADATVAEIWGTVRVACGHTYDPYKVLQGPFVYSDMKP